jgi:predicted TIM-barrel fold metal-dependent hydrolase
MLYAGRPARLRPSKGQVTFNDEDMADLGVRANGVDDEGFRVPGSLLGKLNPLKGLDEAGRLEFARRYRALQAQLDDPVSRLTVMDELGVDAVVNYIAPLGIEYEFEEDWEGLYANLRAINRYIATEWGFTHRNRLFTPPLVSFASAEGAIAELDHLMRDEPPKLIQIPTGHSMFTSPFRPELDPFWARVNEAGINICTHLASLTFYGRQATAWSEPEVMLGDMDAFQYLFFYGDRPAMETVGAAILQGLFSRFGNIKLLVSEQGSLWVPYLIKGMDTTFFMGRKATWGSLEQRPSDYFRQRVFVAPWPEENVERVVQAVGTDPIVFGSDFPHGNGLPDPAMYLPQLKACTDEQTRAIMRGNLGRFLGLP